MSLLNLDLLSNLDSELKKDTPVFFMKQQDVETGQPIHIRLLPPKASYGGRPYVKVDSTWLKIGQRHVKVVSPSMFEGGLDLLDQYKYQVAGGTDPSAKAMVSDEKLWNKSQVFLLPCVIIENIKYAKDGSIESYSIKDNKPCIFQCGVSVLKQINTLVTNLQYHLNTEGLGILHPTNGRTLTLSKDKSGQKIDYKIVPWANSSAIDPIYGDICEDIVNMTKKQVFSDRYINSLVKEFLTGVAEMPEPEYRYPELRVEHGEDVASPLPIAAPVFAASTPNVIIPATTVVQTAQPAFDFAPLPTATAAAPVSSNLMDILAANAAKAE